MATSDNPLTGNSETDPDSPEIRNIPLKDLQTGELTDPEDEERDEDIERGDL